MTKVLLPSVCSACLTQVTGMVCYAMLCDAMLCYAMLCCAVLCCAIFTLFSLVLSYVMTVCAVYAMLCSSLLFSTNFVMSFCHVMLCYAMLCLFSHLTHSHTDAIRGVRAARQTLIALRKHGIHTSVGVTTGHAFCGSVGSPTRCEYAVIGDTVRERQTDDQ